MKKLETCPGRLPASPRDPETLAQAPRRPRSGGSGGGTAWPSPKRKGEHCNQALPLQASSSSAKKKTDSQVERPGLPGHLVLDHFSVTLNRVSNLLVRCCTEDTWAHCLDPANGHSPGGQCLGSMQL